MKDHNIDTLCTGSVQVHTLESEQLPNLLTELRRRDRANASTLSLLLFDWPMANAVINKVHDFCEAALACEERKLLVYPIIEVALIDYQKVTTHGKNKKYNDTLRLSVFMETIITETCKALDVAIIDGKGRIWDLEYAPLSQWLSDYSGRLCLSQSKYDESAIELRKALYQLVASDDVKNVLRRSEYEKAVVDGNIRIGH